MASRLLAAQTTSLSAPLKFCIEDTEFLPFNYFVRENGKPTSVSDGYDIELLSLAFASKNLSYQVHPYLGCAAYNLCVMASSMPP
jgi:hypothetical protein